MSTTKPQLPSWGTAIAGATGAVLANAAVYPLDIVKTKLQVQVSDTTRKTKTVDAKKEEAKENGSTDTAAASYSAVAKEGVEIQDDPKHTAILTPSDSEEEEPHYTSTLHALRTLLSTRGPSSLYTGLPASLVGVASTNFAYFYWYTLLRRASPPSSTLSELTLGAAAGALAQLFTIPVAVITTRQQTRSPSQPAQSLLATGREVIAEDGPRGLWRGLKASLVLVVNPAITYGSYARFRELLFPGRRHLRAWESFLLGAMSKAVATVVTQPLIVAKVGLQSRPPKELRREGRRFTGFGEVMRFVVEREGVRGLFKGIGPQILKGLLVQGVLMMIKERMELLFMVLYGVIGRMRERRAARLGGEVVLGGKR